MKRRSQVDNDRVELGSTLTDIDGELELDGRPVPEGTELELAVPGGWVPVVIREPLGGWLQAGLAVRSGEDDESAGHYLVRLRFGQHDAEFRWPKDRPRRGQGDEGEGTGSRLYRSRGQWMLSAREVVRGSKVELAVPPGWLTAVVVRLSPTECRLAIPASTSGEVPPEGREASRRRYLVAESSPAVLRLRWPRESEDGFPGPEPDILRRDHLPPSRSRTDFSPNTVEEESGPLAWHLGPEAVRPNRTGLIVTRGGDVMVVRTDEQLREALANVPRDVEVELYDLFDLGFGGVVKRTTHEMLPYLAAGCDADDRPPLSSRSGPGTRPPGGRLVGQPEDKFSWRIETADGSGEQIVDNEVVEVATTGGWVRGTIQGLGTGRPPWLELSFVPAPPLGGEPLPGKLFLPVDLVLVRRPQKHHLKPMVNPSEGTSLPPRSHQQRRPPPLPLPLSKRVPARKRTRKRTTCRSLPVGGDRRR
jgi:hypothetical protein